MSAHAFVLLFTFVEAFGGGPVRVTFEAPSASGCERLRVTVTRELDDLRLRYRLAEGCHEVAPPARIVAPARGHLLRAILILAALGAGSAAWYLLRRARRR